MFGTTADVVTSAESFGRFAAGEADREGERGCVTGMVNDGRRVIDRLLMSLTPLFNEWLRAGNMYWSRPVYQLSP